MIDLTELGVYSIDLTTNQITKSPRVANWYGLPEMTDVATSVSAIQESDRARVSQVIADAIRDKANSYKVEYGVINALTGQKRILRTTGQLIYDPAGQPVRVDSSVFDITVQHSLQIALEQQVALRTDELATANQELTAINEEMVSANTQYTVLNTQLVETNGLLVRSNENLQQFAYVASHDLQEPLRKIQAFGDLLKTRLKDLEGSEELLYVDRMQLAASRMSTLIKDLLSYSRISTQRSVEEPVPLDKVVVEVLDALDLGILEADAQVEVDSLPVVTGDASQLNQLFQNLISNALKFRQADVRPLIRISSQLLAVQALPPDVKPVRQASFYHRIEVADNGIGFDERYVNRIFQVFQRLHGKGTFAGTGIGLAICEKVVTNHGGVITASSRLGQGATFIIYLPD